MSGIKAPSVVRFEPGLSEALHAELQLADSNIPHWGFTASSTSTLRLYDFWVPLLLFAIVLTLSPVG